MLMSWSDSNQFLIKEHINMFKVSNSYDIFDLTSGKKILESHEEKLGFFTKIFRYTDYKRMTPFEIQVRDLEGDLIIEVSRSINLMRANIKVHKAGGELIGSFRQQLFSVGGQFAVLDKNDKEICMLTGKWTGWEFKFASKTQEYAQVTKKWAGIGKELLTTADNYVLNIDRAVDKSLDLKRLILAAVICIDMVFKE